jgi:hypothetical protein
MLRTGHLLETLLSVQGITLTSLALPSISPLDDRSFAAQAAIAATLEEGRAHTILGAEAPLSQANLARENNKLTPVTTRVLSKGPIRSRQRTSILHVGRIADRLTIYVSYARS